jgi:phosphoserine phosphatase RsbU/P
VFYTDGVIEGGRPGRLFGEDRLHDLVRSCVGLGADELIDLVVSAAVDFQRGVLRDDIAVLVLQAAPRGS